MAVSRGFVVDYAEFADLLGFGAGRVVVDDDFWRRRLSDGGGDFVKLLNCVHVEQHDGFGGFNVGFKVNCDGHVLQQRLRRLVYALWAADFDDDVWQKSSLAAPAKRKLNKWRLRQRFCGKATEQTMPAGLVGFGLIL